jgi:homoserine kinase
MPAAVRIRVPATSANLGPGFDTLGMALQFYNHFEASPAETLSVKLLPATCVDIEGLSLVPENNLFSQAYQAYFRFRGTPLIPAALAIEGHIPLSRGLGSSSTAIIAGLFLADLMSGAPLGKAALIPWAVELEGHPDNVVPALMGQVWCCMADHTHSFSLRWPESWGIILVIPPSPLSTHEARQSLPPNYPLEDTLKTVRGIAAWIHAIEHQDTVLFRYALSSDRLHQPYRGRLIPEYPILKGMLESTDVMGAVISGSGSTLAVFTPTSDNQQKTLAMLKAPDSPLAQCKIITVQPDSQGAVQVS